MSLSRQARVFEACHILAVGNDILEKVNRQIAFDVSRSGRLDAEGLQAVHEVFRNFKLAEGSEGENFKK